MITIQEIVIRLVVAAVLGSAVGLERERLDWAAGLRTHMLVCVGSALAVIISAFGFKDILGTANVTLDPSRIAAQVISGIGFLGAGTILFLRSEVVRGLTTAAGLWQLPRSGWRSAQVSMSRERLPPRSFSSSWLGSNPLSGASSRIEGCGNYT